MNDSFELTSDWEAGQMKHHVMLTCFILTAVEKDHTSCRIILVVNGTTLVIYCNANSKKCITCTNKPKKLSSISA
jgi:hypothetical protein